ncbi:hypothetical protein TNCV_4997401 [Trichonephila clavipes]|nr:hypothetical protein TNCV_4997401 [Trichonephila clavipes]
MKYEGGNRLQVDMNPIMLSALSMSPVELPYVPILLNETFTKALWDTGAEKSFISKVYKKWTRGSKPIRRARSCQSAGDASLRCSRRDIAVGLVQQIRGGGFTRWILTLMLQYYSLGILQLCPGKDLVLPNINVDQIATNSRVLLISLPNNAMSTKSPFTTHKALKGIGTETS